MACWKKGGGSKRDVGVHRGFIPMGVPRGLEGNGSGSKRDVGKNEGVGGLREEEITIFLVWRSFSVG